MGFLSKLREGLGKTRDALMGGIESVLRSFVKVDEDFLDELEEILITSDVGVGAAEERFWPFLLSSEVILLPTGAFCGVFAPVEPEPTPLPQANRYLSAPSRQESMQSKQSTHLL